MTSIEESASSANVAGPPSSVAAQEEAMIVPVVVCSACSLPPRRRRATVSSSDNKQEEEEIIPLKKCTRCQAAAYHDVACQKRHYPIHKKVCRKIRAREEAEKESRIGTSDDKNIIVASRNGNNKDNAWFRIEQRPSKGNCMVSTRVIQPDERLGEFLPIALPVLFESCRSSHCAICFASNTIITTTTQQQIIELQKLYDDARYQVYICQKCKASSNCQGQLALLRQEVAAVRSCSHIPRILATAILVYRIALAVLQKNNNNVAWKDIECMIWHPLQQQQQQQAGGASDAAIHQQAILATVTSLLQLNGYAIEISRIQGILARIKVNAFTITRDNNDNTTRTGDDSSLSLGIGLYGEKANYMNHSCVPNLRQSFSTGVPGQAPRLKVVTCQQDSAIPPNEELTISYVDTSSSREARQEELMRSYHFKCQCPACLHQ